MPNKQTCSCDLQGPNNTAPSPLLIYTDCSLKLKKKKKKDFNKNTKKSKMSLRRGHSLSNSGFLEKGPCINSQRIRSRYWKWKERHLVPEKNSRMHCSPAENVSGSGSSMWYCSISRYNSLQEPRVRQGFRPQYANDTITILTPLHSGETKNQIHPTTTTKKKEEEKHTASQICHNNFTVLLTFHHSAKPTMWCWPC